MVLIGLSQSTAAFNAAFANTGVPVDIAYFVGEWTVSLKAEAEAISKWTVKEDKNGEWLEGQVERSGEKMSSDYWRKVGNVIERYIFTSDGLYIRLASSGWKAGSLTFTGLSTGKAGDFRVRVTITKQSETKFRALWEKQGDDGKWTAMSDETCSK